MLPEYKPGDRVLTFNWQKPKRGDVIVFKLNGKNLIKRVEEVKGKTYHVLGDNKKESSNVRPFGENTVVGKVVYKY